jgi:hypothetical protein
MRIRATVVVITGGKDASEGKRRLKQRRGNDHRPSSPA